MAVTQAPEQRKANRELTKVIAAALRVKRSRVRLLSGGSAAKTVFSIEGVTLRDLQQRINELLTAD